MDKKTIERNFSRFAFVYDKYASVQKKAARELLFLTKKERFTNILELGCGTGNYTLLLSKEFGCANIKALDICEKMVSVARHKFAGRDIDFLIQDAEKLRLREKFDLVTSNACFQWFEDPEKALSKYKSLLKKDGIISFSIFGPRTFCELNSSIKNVLKEASIAVDGFIPAEKIKSMLLRSFKDIKLKEVRYKENFSSLKDLLDNIKYTGTRGNGLGRKIYLSHRILEKIEKDYLENFKEIKATYQVFLCRARKG